MSSEDATPKCMEPNEEETKQGRWVLIHFWGSDDSNNDESDDFILYSLAMHCGERAGGNLNKQSTYLKRYVKI